MKAILIGRFQCVSIDGALKQLIEKLIRDHDLVGIVIGNNKTGATRMNPLDLESRKEMLQTEFGSIKIISIDDHPSDDVWSMTLDEQVKKNFHGESVLLFGSDDGFIERYSGSFEVRATGRSFNPDLKPILPSDKEASAFRRGVLQGMGRTYPKVYPTVDMAVFRNQKKELLLGMKGIEKKWRLLGGFSDPGDDTYEAAATRELWEECGLTDIDSVTYEASFKVDDWRYRHEEDKIITILFSADYRSGTAKGSDDIEVVQWFPIAEVKNLISENQVASEHLPLFQFLLAKYKD